MDKIKVEIELDEKVFWLVKQMANQSDRTFSELVVYAIEKLAEAEPPKDRILGGWSDEPEVVDELLADIISDRAVHSLKSESWIKH
ncbi:MAG: hypothetical protein WBV73_28560 [Phormidium sp.]